MTERKKIIIATTNKIIIIFKSRLSLTAHNLLQKSYGREKNKELKKEKIKTKISLKINRKLKLQ